MPRYKIIIEYDGTGFVGWQRQTNGLAIQAVLEGAIFAASGEQVVVHGAGRTDAGVHASGQVGHFDLTRHWRLDRLRDAINAHMRAHRIAVLDAQSVSDEFEARFSAIRRSYIYRLVNRRAPGTFDRGYAWYIRRRLDAEAMQEAAQRLLGRHDFSTFRASECQANSPVRTLEHFSVVQTGDRIDIHAKARSFLHHQVRSMVGSLEHVGSGKWSADDLEEALHARDRARCGVVAPACGLYLVGVDYDDAEEALAPKRP